MMCTYVVCTYENLYEVVYFLFFLYSLPLKKDKNAADSKCQASNCKIMGMFDYVLST